MNYQVFLLAFFLLFSSFAAVCSLLAPSWPCPDESSWQAIQQASPFAEAPLPRRLPPLSSRLPSLVGSRASASACASLV